MRSCSFDLLFPQVPTFAFEVVTVNLGGEIINRRRQQAEYFADNLGNGVILEMVSIPGGSFMMGLSKSERYPHSNYDLVVVSAKWWTEGIPQHRVKVAPFYMGKYPVTQAQWQAVAALPPVDGELNPDPSEFKGANRPVENVSWYDAVEFCARLSLETGRHYRLSSEAEWEYACRAGTTTSIFHFGETITPDLANYRGSANYASGAKGVDREETTDVGSFPPNAFGLYDMHGNVWEWCADAWHENYQGAPSDGSVWESGADDSLRLLRGGSRFNYSWYCRCAYRDRSFPDYGSNYDGLRVVCNSPTQTS